MEEHSSRSVRGQATKKSTKMNLPRVRCPCGCLWERQSIVERRGGATRRAKDEMEGEGSGPEPHTSAAMVKQTVSSWR